jgi:hypothetical protein
MLSISLIVSQSLLPLIGAQLSGMSTVSGICQPPMKLLQCALVALGLAAATLQLRAQNLSNTLASSELLPCESRAAASAVVSGDTTQCTSAGNAAAGKVLYKAPPNQPSGFTQTLGRTPDQQRRVDQLLVGLRKLAARPLSAANLQRALPWIAIDASQSPEIEELKFSLRGADERGGSSTTVFFQKS